MSSNWEIYELIAGVLGILYMGMWLGSAIWSEDLAFRTRIFFCLAIISFAFVGWVLNDAWRLLWRIVNG